jgi:hypothetical protein
LDKWDAVKNILDSFDTIHKISISNDIDKAEGDYEVWFEAEVPSDWPEEMTKWLAQDVIPPQLGE